MDLKQLTSMLLITPLIRAAVAIHTVPAGTPWRRSCDNCGEPLSAFRPPRAFGPTGRCGSCRTRIGARPFLVEAAAIAAVALVGVLLALGRLSVVESLALTWWAGWAIPLPSKQARVLPGEARRPRRLRAQVPRLPSTGSNRETLRELANAWYDYTSRTTAGEIVAMATDEPLGQRLGGRRSPPKCPDRSRLQNGPEGVASHGRRYLSGRGRELEPMTSYSRTSSSLVICCQPPLTNSHDP